VQDDHDSPTPVAASAVPSSHSGAITRKSTPGTSDIKTVTWVMKAITHVMKVIYGLMKTITGVVKIITGVIKVFTGVMKAVTHVMKVIYGLMKAITGVMKAVTGVIKIITDVLTGIFCLYFLYATAAPSPRLLPAGSAGRMCQSNGLPPPAGGTAQSTNSSVTSTT
jgi:hypothetical protein